MRLIVLVGMPTNEMMMDMHEAAHAHSVGKNA